jgi:GAF domain-containing protein
MENDPIHDPERLKEIIRLDVLSEDIQGLLDDLTQKAAERFDLPISLVSIVLDDAQTFVSSHGLDSSWLGESRGTPMEWSFCRFTVKDGKPFLVENASLHERTKTIPLVYQDGVMCYAGIPLKTSSGKVLGSLCVIGDKARSFEEKELADLSNYAAEVVRRLEERAAAKVAE